MPDSSVLRLLFFCKCDLTVEQQRDVFIKKNAGSRFSWDNADELILSTRSRRIT